MLSILSEGKTGHRGIGFFILPKTQMDFSSKHSQEYKSTSTKIQKT